MVQIKKGTGIGKTAGASPGGAGICGLLSAIISSTKLCNLLLVMNLMAMAAMSRRSQSEAMDGGGGGLRENNAANAATTIVQTNAAAFGARSNAAVTTTAGTNAAVEAGNKEHNFFDIASKTGTDKVLGQVRLAECLRDQKNCHTDAKNPKCRPRGHFYHTIYQRFLGPYSTDEAEPFQFAEIGYFKGDGFEAYQQFLPKAEAHSIEISCLPAGPRDEGKWPWGNFGEKHRQYPGLLKNHRLHCGDASSVEFLHDVWTNYMKRDGNAPPLKVVIDDGSHIAAHMVQTVFFWLPRIAPGGILVVEDIQPSNEANKFRTEFLPQIMMDLHFCGESRFPDDECFPSIQRFLHSIHCELHICVFERNDLPAEEPSMEESTSPQNALDMSKCKK